MNGDTVDAPVATPVRRSGRARKPNSRFADDELDSCFKKIVSGIASPDTTVAPATPSAGRPRKAAGRRKDSKSEDVEEKSEKGKKEVKNEEVEEKERGKKPSEECEEKSDRRRKEKGEEECEQGRKTNQNEDVEKSACKKENRNEEVEEKKDKRRRKDSQSEESSTERKEKVLPDEDNSSHSLPNGLDAGREEAEECVRVTRSGRREVRKRGKDKEEQEQQQQTLTETFIEQAPLENSGDLASSEKPASRDAVIIKTETRKQEGKECVEEASYTPSEPLPVTLKDKKENTMDNSAAECVKKDIRVLPTHPNTKKGEKTTEVCDKVVVGASQDKETAVERTPTPQDKDDKDKGNAPKHKETRQGGGAKECVTDTQTNGNTNRSITRTSQKQDTTTTTTTTATSTTTTTTTTTTITIPTIIQPPLPPDAPTDPRLNRRTRANTTTTTAPTAIVSPIHNQPQTIINVCAIPIPSTPPKPPVTRDKGETALPQGCKRPQGNPRQPQGSFGETETLKVAYENIPLPPTILSSPSKESKVEENVKKVGGKRDRKDHEKTAASQRLEEEREEEGEVPSSPLAKRRKEKVEEDKEETKRKRLTDAKEDDKRKRRKVEEVEEKEETTPKPEEKTPLLPPSVDVNKPSTPAPPTAPPAAPLPPSPLPKRLLEGPPQQSPKNRKDPSSPLKVEPGSPKEKDSPKRIRESLRSRTSLIQDKDASRDTKDTKGGKDSLKGTTTHPIQCEGESKKDTQKGKGVEAVSCSVDTGKGRIQECGKAVTKAKEECVKGEKSASKGEKEPVKGREAAKCDKEAVKSVKEDAVKGGKNEKEVAKSEKDVDKSKEDVGNSKEDLSKSVKDSVKSKESPTKSMKSEKEAVKSDRDKDTVKNDKGKTSKSEKDISKTKEEAERTGKTEKDTAKSKEEQKTTKTEKETTKSKEEQNKKDINKTQKIADKSEKVTAGKQRATAEATDTSPQTTENSTVPSLFLPTQQEPETGDKDKMRILLGLSSSSTTTIPFLEDTPVAATDCVIPGLSILASDAPVKAAPKKEQNHRNWFAIGGSRKNQARTGTADNGIKKEKEEEEEEEVKEIKPEEKKVEEIKVEEKKKVEEEAAKEEKDTAEDEERKRKEAEEREARNKAIVEERMKSFVHLKENAYLTERKRTKRHKEVRRMVCDCSLTKEEMERGEVGCGEDCLNRLLMIECGSRCPLGDRCINKRFLNRQYGDVEVFNAEEKGCGVRAKSDIPPGTFLMEYVGEVFDTREFKRRRKEYARDMRDHFYFMALKSDQLIDSTRMGNISRFINHSCEPNAETQKWTVNGDLRIGFFSKTLIEAGEEINFDYRLERYGREPQRCYCGTPNCRGWLGEAPDEQTKEEKDEARRKEERERRKREERRAFFEDIDLEEEIEKLNSHKLRNRQDTLNLSRIMVRAEEFNSRIELLLLLQTGEPACRRLFLDYHGLKVLWSWMADLGISHQYTELKLEILKTLEVLPITNKTQLTDSRVLSLVERWSAQGEYTPSSTSSTTLSPPPPPAPPKTDETPLPPPTTSLTTEADTNKKSSDTSEESDSETDPKIAIEASSADDSSLDSEAENPKAGVEEESSDSNDAKDAATAAPAAVPSSEAKLRVERLSDEEKEVQELLELHKTMVALAKKLLDAWKNLKEFFRIPKKERIEMMKEHEREVDRGYREYLDQASESDRDNDRDKERRDKDRDRYNRRDHHYDRRRRSPDRDKERFPRGRGGVRDERPSDSPKMSKEQRRQLFELKVQQQEEEAKQRKMQEEMWTMHVDRCRLLGHDPYLTPIFDPTYQYFWDPVAANWQPYTGSGEVLPPGSPVQGQGTPPYGGKVLSIPLPGEAEAVGVEGAEAPGAITIHLPPRWRLARDASGHVYFYHGKTRITQWEPPVALLNSGLGSDSSSDSSSDSDSDSSSTTDSEDFSTEEEEEEVEEELVEHTDVSDEKMIRRPKGTKRRRSEALVQERVISPILEIDKEAARRERREAKERAREEARQERQEERNTRGQKEESTQPQQQEEQQQQEQPEGVETGTTTVTAVVVEKERDRDRERERDRERDRERERERRSERHEARVKREKVKSKERAATAIADNSDTARKLKDTFRSKMATFIVSVLNPYRKGDCREGKITCTEDFKYLARKLTHFVMVKELKQLHSIEALDCSDSVKHKTRDFVRKYMSKYGSVFKRDPNDTKEY